ncbi:hypothetical protein [Deinococcus sp.]|uniref:hypothetical protein n=1 Tax=Deinococcus sp. TaxID=47478 RepID=UPI003CC6C044
MSGATEYVRPAVRFTERPQPKSALHPVQQPNGELKEKMDSMAFRMLARERSCLLFGLE